MSLKRIIKRDRLLKAGVIDASMTLPGEPMIYSIKYNIGNRTRSVQFFRNEKWKSLLKCCFPSYYKTYTPCVIMVRFFVTPPSDVKIKDSDVRKETVPAVHTYEICDYLLSFLEMLHHVLINSYRQVVKIDAEKYYSKDPRTVFKFMKWDDYVKLQNNDTFHTKGKSIDQDRQVLPLQPKRSRDAKD